uniref:Uncharacterized protein n=1 Tax=Trypanosoma congolense (strain IL3000) TaxID=1068625 RepID=G0UND1_TRYCI|nr:hypothetical protein, unlikely [Trypanosoma congolense IL3000]
MIEILKRAYGCRPHNEHNHRRTCSYTVRMYISRSHAKHPPPPQGLLHLSLPLSTRQSLTAQKKVCTKMLVKTTNQNLHVSPHNTTYILHIYDAFLFPPKEKRNLM